MLSEKKFKEGMFLLCEQFQREASEVLLKGYWLVLKELTDGEFERAIMILLSQTKFHKLPLPAEIREAIHGNIEDKAILALNKVENAIRQIGLYRSVVFDDPVIHMAIQALDGWQTICMMLAEEWKWKRKEFISFYKAFTVNPCQYPEKLIGYHDHNNEINGYKEHIKAPVLIGDKGKAQAVLENATAKNIIERKALELSNHKL